MRIKREYLGYKIIIDQYQMKTMQDDWIDIWQCSINGQDVTNQTAERIDERLLAMVVPADVREEIKSYIYEESKNMTWD